MQKQVDPRNVISVPPGAEENASGSPCPLPLRGQRLTRQQMKPKTSCQPKNVFWWEDILSSSEEEEFDCDEGDICDAYNISDEIRVNRYAARKKSTRKRYLVNRNVLQKTKQCGICSTWLRKPQKI